MVTAYPMRAVSIVRNGSELSPSIAAGAKVPRSRGEGKPARRSSCPLCCSRSRTVSGRGSRCHCSRLGDGFRPACKGRMSGAPRPTNRHLRPRRTHSVPRDQAIRLLPIPPSSDQTANPRQPTAPAVWAMDGGMSVTGPTVPAAFASCIVAGPCGGSHCGSVSGSSDAGVVPATPGTDWTWARMSGSRPSGVTTRTWDGHDASSSVNCDVFSTMVRSSTTWEQVCSTSRALSGEDAEAAMDRPCAMRPARAMPSSRLGETRPNRGWLAGTGLAGHGAPASGWTWTGGEPKVFMKVLRPAGVQSCGRC